MAGALLIFFFRNCEGVLNFPLCCSEISIQILYQKEVRFPFHWFHEINWDLLSLVCRIHWNGFLMSAYLNLKEFHNDWIWLISVQYITFVFHIKRSSISNLEELFLKLIFFVNWAYSLYSIIHNISCIALITWLKYGDTKRPFWNFCTFLSLSLQIT